MNGYEPRTSDAPAGGYEWWRAAAVPLPSRAHPFLPAVVFARLTGGVSELGCIRVYRTRDEALAALERAAKGAAPVHEG